MRASREVRSWVNRLRQRHGRKNGVVSGGLFDNPWMEIKQAKSRKQRQRSGRNLADAHSNPPPQKEQQHEP